MTYRDHADELVALVTELQALVARERKVSAEGAGERAGPAAVEMPWSAARIGRVVSVKGAQVIALLETPRENQLAAYIAEDPDALQIGALVKMRTQETIVFGMICGLSIPSRSLQEQEPRIVELELVGEALISGENKPLVFRRGVSLRPTLGDNVYATTQADLRQVYAKPEVASARIGTICQDQSLPAFIAIDDLLGKHFAVLGTTGSGKSCAVATILRAVLDQHREGHILLLDPHNEYPRAFGDCAEVLGPGDLKLPYWLLNFEELRETLIDRTEKRDAEQNILRDAVIYAKQAYNGQEDGMPHYGADSPVPYRMSDVIQRIGDLAGRLERPTDSAPYLRLRERIEALQGDRRFDFMFQEGLTVRDTMADVLSQLFRIPANGRPVTILDLSEIPSDIMNVVISLVCRLTFDFALWSDRSVPILLVCEEAHRYAGENTDASFEPTKRALSKIAREGRKYGVSVCLVSQRPSELPVGILSQCNTIFAMRMSNQKDQEFVRGTLSESGLGLMDSLPSLRTGEAIGVGEGVPVPVRFCFDHLPAQSRPHSGTACFSGAWKDSEKSLHFVSEVVERWRRQHR
jgi:DNA helicase HerA-like ATPase